MNYQDTKNNEVKWQTRNQKTDLTWRFSTLGTSRRFGSRLEKYE